MKPVALLLAGVAVASPFAAAGQDYPSRPIHIVNQFRAGASGDITLRTVAETLSKIAGQPVVVENKPGGAGMVAAAYVAKSAPDGYTLLNATGGLTTYRFLVKSREFEPLEALVPVTRIGQPITTFVASTGFPAGSLKELIEYAKRNPGKVTYGTSGIGSPHHLSGEQIQLITGVKLTHVPYKASAAALLDTVAGQIASTFSIYSVTRTHIESGKVRVLAVVREERAKHLPDVPTMAEILPGFEEPPSWTGLFFPKGVPEAVLKRFSGDVMKALRDQPLTERLAKGGMELQPDTPEQFAALIKRQTELVGKLVKSAGIKPR